MSLSADELRQIGFTHVGEDVRVSRDARFYEVQGRLGDGVRIDDFAIITGQVVLDEGVHISPFCFLGGTGGRIHMHPHSGLAAQVCVYTKSADYTSEDLAADAKTVGDVTIGERAIVGAGCKIMPGVSVGAHVSVGFNCVISKDIEPGSAVVARSIGLVTVSRRDP